MRRYVLGVDGSEASDKALNWVLGHGEECEIEVVLVSVAEVLSTISLKKDCGDLVDRLMVEPRELAAQAKARLDAAKIPARVVVEAGRPAMVITRVARDEKADGVVVGSVGKHAVDRLLLGSVSTRLLETCPCTVVVVK